MNFTLHALSLSLSLPPSLVSSFSLLLSRCSFVSPAVGSVVRRRVYATPGIRLRQSWGPPFLASSLFGFSIEEKAAVDRPAFRLSSCGTLFDRCVFVNSVQTNRQINPLNLT